MGVMVGNVLFWQSVPGTRLESANSSDGRIWLKGPCGHVHAMTQDEAAALGDWLGGAEQLAEFRARQMQINAMLDAEIGA